MHVISRETKFGLLGTIRLGHSFHVYGVTVSVKEAGLSLQTKKQFSWHKLQ